MEKTTTAIISISIYVVQQKEKKNNLHNLKIYTTIRILF